MLRRDRRVLIQMLHVHTGRHHRPGMPPCLVHRMPGLGEAEDRRTLRRRPRSAPASRSAPNRRSSRTPGRSGRWWDCRCRRRARIASRGLRCRPPAGAGSAPGCRRRCPSAASSPGSGTSRPAQARPRSSGATVRGCRTHGAASWLRPSAGSGARHYSFLARSNRSFTAPKRSQTCRKWSRSCPCKTRTIF